MCSDFDCFVGDSSLSEACTLLSKTVRYHAEKHSINQEDIIDFLWNIPPIKKHYSVYLSSNFPIDQTAIFPSIATAMKRGAKKFDLLGRVTLSEYSLVLPAPRSIQTIEKLFRLMLLHYSNYYGSPAFCFIYTGKSSLKLFCYVNMNGVLEKIECNETMPSWLSYSLALLYGEDIARNPDRKSCSFGEVCPKAKPLPNVDTCQRRTVPDKIAIP